MVKFYKRIFITPGLADYKDDDYGTLLIEKSTIDKALPTLKNKSVIISHDGNKEVGEVVDCYFDNQQGAFVVGFNVWDDEANKLLENDYSISCTYNILENGGKGIYHNINYDNEAKTIEFKNIAIVENPRYEEAKTIINSIKNKSKEFMGLFKKKEIKNEAEDVRAEIQRLKKQILTLEKKLNNNENNNVENEVEDKEEVKEDIQEDKEIKNEEENKDNNQSEAVNLEDVFNLLSMIAEKVGVTFGDEEKTEEKENVENSNDEKEDKKEEVENSCKNEVKEEEKEEKREIKNSISKIQNRIIKNNVSNNSYKTREELINETNKKFYC